MEEEIKNIIIGLVKENNKITLNNLVKELYKIKE